MHVDWRCFDRSLNRRRAKCTPQRYLFDDICCMQRVAFHERVSNPSVSLGQYDEAQTSIRIREALVFRDRT